MKKWLLLSLVVLLVGIQLFAATTKVAILPLKRLDRSSDYIRKLLTVRDLDLTFDKHEQYDLISLKAAERLVKEHGYTDVDDLQPEELAEIAKELGADLVITGNVSTRNQQVFTVSTRFYSARTNELRQFSFDVGKEKRARWKALDEKFMKELDGFISIEFDKIFNIALNFYANGNFVEAERNLLSVLSVNPEKKEAYFYLGAIYNRTKNYPKALQYLNEGLKREENNLQAMRTLVDVYEATGNVNAKMLTMEKLATLESDEELWLTIGNIYAEAKDNENAIRALKQSIKTNASFDGARYRLAFLLYDLQRFDEAIEYLEFAFSKFPDNDIISQRLATSYQRANRINEAIGRYEQLIIANPSNTFAYLNLVGLYRSVAGETTNPTIANEMYTKAINTMNSLRTLQPNNALVYLNLASIYLAQNANNNAETNANLAIERDSSLYQAYIILAMVQQARGTEKYNQFVDLEKRASAAVGRQATNLGRERDAARSAATGHFRRADELLKTARARTTDSEVLADINTRIQRVGQLINQTTSF